MGKLYERAWAIRPAGIAMNNLFGPFDWDGYTGLGKRLLNGREMP
jgi:hypothetical protein